MEKPLKLVVLVLGLFAPLLVNAQTSRTRPAGFVQKAVVFPLETPTNLKAAADETWWSVREQLTDTKRMLVAAKRFMVQKDVFQPRGDLQPPDVILLSQLLDAEVLITMQLVSRTLRMTAYDSYDGGLLWTESIDLHPSLPIEKQLKDSGLRLSRDFIASLPSQGHTILDPLINRAVYEEGDVRLAKVDVGANSRTAEKDVIQWIRVDRLNEQALFGSGGRIEVIAEGEVLKADKGILTVEIKRAKQLSDVQAFTLVRIPREAEFLTEQFALRGKTQALKPELRYNPMPPAKDQEEEGKPLFAALTAIASMIALLLLAL